MPVKKLHFYCQNLCGQADFSIDDWNEAFDFCEKAGIKGVERDKILHPEKFPCATQCFSCIAIVGERRLQTNDLLIKQNNKDIGV